MNINHTIPAQEHSLSAQTPPTRTPMDEFSEQIMWSPVNQDIISYKSSSLRNTGPGIIKIKNSISKTAGSFFLILIGLITATVFYLAFLLYGNQLTLLFGSIFGVAFIGSGIAPLLKNKNPFTLNFNERFIVGPDKEIIPMDQICAVQLIRYTKRIQREKTSSHTSRSGSFTTSTPYTEILDCHELNLVKYDKQRITLMIGKYGKFLKNEASMLAEKIGVPLLDCSNHN